MLYLKNVAKYFSGPDGKVTALKDVSFSISPGEFLAISGPSGCGKTTLLLTAGSLLKPDAGQVSLDSQDPYQLNPELRSKLRASTIGFVFQQFHLIPYLTVRENITTPSLVLPTKELDQRAEELLNYFGLEDRASHLSSQLSTGERQRTALARALFNQPKIIMADEPTGNLDPKNTEMVFNYFSRYVEQEGCVLMVTHDPQVASHANRAIQMQQGQIYNPL